MANTRRLKISRNEKDRVLPRDFFKMLLGQFFPILSITYVASIAGISLYLGGGVAGAVDELMQRVHVYRMALWMAIWVSVPGVVWLCLKGSIRFSHHANAWYIVTAGLMVLTLGVSFLLFPEQDSDLRLFILFVLPIHVVMYLFLSVFKLNQWIAQPFQLLAGILLVFGFLL